MTPMTDKHVAGLATAARREEADSRKPIAVWDLPTRVFHWSLALSFAGAFVTADSERWRDIHVMFGYTLLGLILFRLVWGVVGSRYARFSSFVTGPGRVAAYLGSLLRGRPEHHVGHNPAGSIVIVGLLGLGLLSALSGLALYYELAGEWLEDVHESAANAMLALVAIHVAGVAVSSLLHRENLVRAMFTGDKLGRAEAAIGKRHRLLGITLLITVLGGWGVWLA